MMWACENFPPEDPIWANLADSVQMLLRNLSGSLEAGYLPHYFIPEINLLERVGEDVRRQCIKIISSILNNVLMAAPFDMPEIRNIINKKGKAFNQIVRLKLLKGIFSICLAIDL